MVATSEPPTTGPPMMKPDARITDIIEFLADAEDYVRGIVSSFIEHGFDKQRSQIRIGVSGKGVFPNYSIVEPCEPEERAGNESLDPKGPSIQLIAAIVEMKRRNPKFGCVRIAQQINYAFGIKIDKMSCVACLPHTVDPSRVPMVHHG